MEIQHAGSPQPTSPHVAPLVVDPPVLSRRGRFLALRAQAPVVVPSLLMCDFGHLADEVRSLEDAGVKAVHLDVMDGHFVPNLSYGLPIAEAVRRLTELPIEAHLMISDPAHYAPQFVELGIDAVTFHIEAVPDPRPLLEQLRAADVCAGLSLNPPTPLSAVVPYLDACDLVLAMSVSPGFGGQKFQSVALNKLRELNQQDGERLLLEVDGGVNDQTIGQCADAGALCHVVGSAIFSHDNYRQRVATLTALASTPSRKK